MNKHLEKGERLLQGGKLEAALEEFLNARKEDPGNDEIVLKAADVYLRLNRLREGRQCYGYLFDKYVGRSDSLKALEFFHELEKMGPVEAKRQVACAQLLEKEKPEEAIQHYRHALDADGGQDPETAVQCLQALAALQPSSLQVHQRLAELAAKLGKTLVAFNAFSRMGELLTAGKQYAEAVEAFEEAFRLSSESFVTKHHTVPESARDSVRHSLARACSQAGKFSRVLELLEQEGEEPVDSQVSELLAEAYFAARQLPKAEALYWTLTPHSPEAVNSLTEIAMEYLRQKELSLALPLLTRLEQHLSERKQQKELMTLCNKVSRLNLSDIATLEFLASLADRLHLDHPLAKALDGMFTLYCAAGEFPRATDALERLIDVDPYDPECFVKLRRLEGKTSPATWKEIAARLGGTSTVAEAPNAISASPSNERTAQNSSEETGDNNTLTDLILQAEIYLRYKLQDKARERLQRIAKLFPGEEQKNEELRTLFEKVGVQSQGEVPLPVAAPKRRQDSPADWSRISQISRNLSRQSTVKGVLSAAVNDIGRLWRASRCVAGLASPKGPPSIALEYISPGAAPSDPVLLGKLVMGLHELTDEQGSAMVAEEVSEDGRLAPLEAPLAALGVQSLIAIPLRDGDQPAGILVLEQCGDHRSWGANDVAALETLSEQIMFAVSNARLRGLMKTLAVADERSGLLHRDSYLICLLSEVERVRAQKTPLAAAILQFSEAAPQLRGSQEETPEKFVRQFENTFASHLRQNDIPIRYGPQSLAVIMPGSTGKEAVFMVERMRRLVASGSPPAIESPLRMAAGVAELVLDAEMDGADLVTELINRVEQALEEAQGAYDTKLLDPPILRR